MSSILVNNKLSSQYDMINLGNINYFKVIMGQSPKSEFYNNNKNGLPFFQGSKDFKDIFPELTTYCSNPEKIAHKDDLLISVRAPVVDINIANIDCCIGRGLAAIRCNKEKILNKYLFYLIKNTPIIGFNGSTFASITKDKLLEHSVPIPPLAIQQQIIAELEQEHLMITKPKALIKHFEQKMANRLNSLWEFPNNSEQN